MDELQLLLIPRVTGHKVSESMVETFDEKTTRITKRTTTYFTELDMTMTWVNAEQPEEMIECPWYGQGVDTAGEKGTGKALTYAEKYFMLKFFNVPTDKDDPDSFQKKHEEKPDKPVEQKPPVLGPILWPQFWQGMKKIGYSESEVHAFAKVESLKEWTREMLDELVKDLKANKNKGDK